MNSLNTHKKDRNQTEQRILEAVGEIIQNEGFEKLGINYIAAKCGLSKVLIYRYFGGLDNLLLEYLADNGIWEHYTISLPKNENMKAFLKTMFHKLIVDMRQKPMLRHLHRWELLNENSITQKLKLKRETCNMSAIAIIASLARHSQEEVAAVASVIMAAITYLSLFSDVCPVYNGIDLQTDSGWKQITDAIELLVDKWLPEMKV